MAETTPRFVRIRKDDHPMRGMIGTITETTQDGYARVTLLYSTINGYFNPEDLQPIQVGTKVIVDHSISTFFQASMMIARGWTPLSRILDIVE